MHHVLFIAVVVLFSSRDRLVVELILGSVPQAERNDKEDCAGTRDTDDNETEPYSPPDAIIFIFRNSLRDNILSIEGTRLPATRLTDTHRILVTTEFLRLVVAALHASGGVSARTDAGLSFVCLLCDSYLIFRVFLAESDSKRGKERLSESDHIVVLSIERH